MEQAFDFDLNNSSEDVVKKQEVSQGAYLILADRLRRTLDYLYEVLDFIEDYTWHEQLQAILGKLKKELATFSQFFSQKDNPVLVHQIPTQWPQLYQDFLNQFFQLRNDTTLATPFAKLSASQQSWIHLIETEIKQVFESSPVLTLDELRAEAKARLLENNLKTFVDAHHSLLSTLKKPTCFISYAWGNQFQERQVHELAYLLKCAGIDVLLDIWCNKVNSIPSFTELVAKDKSDYVVVIGTPLLKQKYQVNITGRGSWVYEELEQIAKRKRDIPNNHGIIKVLLEGSAEEAFPSFLSSQAHDFTNFQLVQHYHEKFINLLELLYAKYSDQLQESIKQLRATLNTDIEVMQHFTEPQLKEILQLEQVTDYEKIADRKQDVIEKLSQSFQMHFAELNPLSLWHVPVLSTNFIGRQALLTKLHDKLTCPLQAPVAMVVCYGLGGVGKTQLALKYVYDHQHDYKYILWFSAESEVQLLNEYLELAKELQLPIKNLSLSQIAEQVKAWLERNPCGLLVYDNAPNAALIEKYRSRIRGKLLITSCNDVWDKNQSVEIEIFKREESCDYIVTLTGFLLQEYQTVIDQLAETLGDLPLALAQACGYIAANQISLQEYLELYTDNCKEMLADSTMPAEMHHDPVAVTWKITFKVIQEQQASAWPLLVSCAYLQANNIPEALLKALFDTHTSHGTLKGFKELLGCLQRYSLLKRTDPIEKIYSMHRLVQDVIRLEYEASKPTTSPNALPEGLNILMECLYEPLKGKQQEEDYQVIHEYAPWIEHCNSFLKHVITDYKNTPSLKLAGFLNHMGTMILVYKDQNHVRQAIIYHLQALNIREQQLGPDSLHVAESYNNLGAALEELGDQTNLTSVIEYYQKALKIHKQLLGPYHPDVAATYNNLAGALIELGGQTNLTTAIEYYHKALKIEEQQLDPDHLAVSIIYNDLGLALQELGGQDNLKTAIEYFQKGLKIREQQLGPDHPDVAINYNNLALALQKLGGQDNLKTATEYHQKALGIYEQQLGLDHPLVAKSYNYLAGVVINLDDQAKFERVIEYIQKALKIQVKQLGPNHLDVATSYNDLGLALQELGGQDNLKTAIEYFQKGLKIREQQLGPDHLLVAKSYHNLAEALIILGGQAKLTTAIEYHQKALKIIEQQFPGHQEVARTYDNLGLALQELGGRTNLETAIEYHQKALKMRKLQLGRYHPDIAVNYDNLAMTLQTLGGQANLEAALKYLRKALKIYIMLWGSDHPLIAMSYTNVVETLQALGGQANLEAANEFHQMALKIVQQLLPMHYRLKLNKKLDEVFGKLRYTNLGTVIKHHSKVLKIREQQFGLDHPKVGMFLLNLAAVCVEFDIKKAHEYFQRAYYIFLAHPDYGSQHPNTQLANAWIYKLASLSTSTSAPSSSHFFTQQKSTPANVDKEKLQALLARYELDKAAVPLAYEIALRRAAGFGSEEELKLLLEVVKNVNVQDDNPTKRKTALHWAVEKGLVAHVKLLIAAGSRSDIKDAANKTALHYASTAELRELLLSAKKESVSEAELNEETQATTAESKPNYLTI